MPHEPDRPRIYTVLVCYVRGCLAPVVEVISGLEAVWPPVGIPMCTRHRDNWRAAIAEEVQGGDVSLQRIVQVEILRALEKDPVLHLEGIAASCHVDLRDVQRGIEQLIRRGAIQLPAEDGRPPASTVLLLTDSGRWYLEQRG